jgi:hypothetical protein
LGDNTLLRREDDRTLGAVLARLEMLDNRLERLEYEVQEFRDTKNKGLGMLMFLGAALPTFGAAAIWVAKRVFHVEF